MNDSSAVFEIIHSIVSTPGNRLSVSGMCKTAGVSRSGYYAWVKAAPVRAEKEQQDRADFDLILEAYKHRGYTKGAQGIYMSLLHRNPPVIMNLKKIRRIMRKYRLSCPIRKANPYRQMMRALQGGRIADNLVQRQFEEYGPRVILLTDISYIPYNGTFAYLSTVLDAYTKQILSYVLSPSREMDFVLETIQQLAENHGVSLTQETIVHSDQGNHYTSHSFQDILSKKRLRQSMSRRGNCWDNAPQESFFGHMKDEIAALIADCDTYERVQAVVDDWMDYYNNDRYQWDLEKLSPREYYRYRQTGVYPLKPGVSKNAASRGAAPDPEV